MSISAIFDFPAILDFISTQYSILSDVLTGYTFRPIFTDLAPPIFSPGLTKVICWLVDFQTVLSPTLAHVLWTPS